MRFPSRTPTFPRISLVMEWHAWLESLLPHGATVKYLARSPGSFHDLVRFCGRTSAVATPWFRRCFSQRTLARSQAEHLLTLGRFHAQIRDMMSADLFSWQVEDADWPGPGEPDALERLYASCDRLQERYQELRRRP